MADSASSLESPSQAKRMVLELVLPKVQLPAPQQQLPLVVQQRQRETIPSAPLMSCAG